MPTVRVPTVEEFQSYTGAHTHVLWNEVGHEWACPACRRSKFEVLRWTKRFPNTPNPFYGWVAPLHKHHDHSVPFGSVLAPRFANVVICDQCNAADGQAKRRLKLPRHFSFSPQEIGSFVSSRPHGPHSIDFEAARRAFEMLKSRI